MSNYQKGKEFEDYVEFIYEWLLKFENENAKISRNWNFKINEIPIELDIYYEFYKAGTTHRVAIECKNWKKPIDKAEVTNFEHSIRIMKNTLGIVVSKYGYTKGAKNLLLNAGIQALTLDNLPELNQVMGMNLFKVYMPKPDDIAEPFYAILEVDKNGAWTGNYVIDEHENGKVMMLFLSKKHGESFIRIRGDRNVSALPLKRGHINYILDLAEKKATLLENLMFGLAFYPSIYSKNELGLAMKAKDLRNEYLR